jgi:hypothetical protein
MPETDGAGRQKSRSPLETDVPNYKMGNAMGKRDWAIVIMMLEMPGLLRTCTMVEAGDRSTQLPDRPIHGTTFSTNPCARVPSKIILELAVLRVVAAVWSVLAVLTTAVKIERKLF